MRAPTHDDSAAADDYWAAIIAACLLIAGISAFPVIRASTVERDPTAPDEEADTSAASLSGSGRGRQPTRWCTTQRGARPGSRRRVRIVSDDRVIADSAIEISELPSRVFRSHDDDGAVGSSDLRSCRFNLAACAQCSRTARCKCDSAVDRALHTSLFLILPLSDRCGFRWLSNRRPGAGAIITLADRTRANRARDLSRRLEPGQPTTEVGTFTACKSMRCWSAFERRRQHRAPLCDQCRA